MNVIIKQNIQNILDHGQGTFWIIYSSSYIYNIYQQIEIQVINNHRFRVDCVVSLSKSILLYSLRSHPFFKKHFFLEHN